MKITILDSKEFRCNEPLRSGSFVVLHEDSECCYCIINMQGVNIASRYYKDLPGHTFFKYADIKKFFPEEYYSLIDEAFFNDEVLEAISKAKKEDPDVNINDCLYFDISFKEDLSKIFNHIASLNKPKAQC